MDTWNTRIEITPVGRYVHALHKADRQLEALQHPGIFSKDSRVKQIATAVYHETNNLRGQVHDEMRRFGGMVIEPEIPDDLEDSTVCECGAIATGDYYGRRFCQSCIDFMEAQETRCIGTGYED